MLISDLSQGRRKNAIAQTLSRALMPNRAYKKLSDWIELVLAAEDYEWRIKQKDWHLPDEVRSRLVDLKAKLSLDGIGVLDTHLNENNSSVSNDNPSSTSPQADPALRHPTTERPPNFPQRASHDPHRRRNRRKAAVHGAPDKIYETRERTVRISRNLSSLGSISASLIRTTMD